MDTPVELLRRAGFIDVAELDGTEEFRAVAKEWLDQWDDHRDALTAVYGEPEFESVSTTGVCSCVPSKTVSYADRYSSAPVPLADRGGSCSADR